MKILDDEDIKLFKSHNKKIYVKCYLTNLYSDDTKKTITTDYNYIDRIEGVITDGNFSVDSSSDIRRTLSLSMVVTDSNFEIGYDKKIWLDKLIIVQIGLSSPVNFTPKWYQLGVFVLKTANYSVSESGNTLSLECSDMVCLLNGDRGGIVRGAKTIEIDSSKTCYPATFIYSDNNVNLGMTVPNYSSWNDLYYVGFTLNMDESTKKQYSGRNVYININQLGSLPLVDYQYNNIKCKDLQVETPYTFKYSQVKKDDKAVDVLVMNHMNSIQGAMESIIKLSGINNYNICKIGYDQTPTTQNPYPYLIPYKLTYSNSDNYYKIVSDLRDLYSGYDTYFNEYGQFICETIPTGEGDMPLLTYNIIDNLILSESEAYDLSEIHNVTEIWGKSLEVDCYNVNVDYVFDHENKVVTIHTNKSFDTEILVGFTNIDLTMNYDRNTINDYSVKIHTDSYGDVELIEDYTNKVLVKVSQLLDNTGYCFKLNYLDYSKTCYAIFYGQFEVHGVNVLTNNTPTQEIIEDFKTRYNGDNISFTVIPESQFSIEKCGELNQSLSGNDYDNIYTNSLALQRAEYENWKSSRFTDAISITTAFIPITDVNRKITYRSLRTNKVDTYLINKVSFSFKDCETNIDMRKYYPIYPQIKN